MKLADLGTFALMIQIEPGGGLHIWRHEAVSIAQAMELLHRAEQELVAKPASGHATLKITAEGPDDT